MLSRPAALAAITALALAAPAPHALADDAPVRALILTGHNNHNWQYTSRVHKDTLEGSGRFIVDITDDPAATLADADGLKKYGVFVLDYNDWGKTRRWGEAGGAAEKNFVDAVRSGTGVVAIHSADNAFVGWKEYEAMLGLMWRETPTIKAGHAAYHEFNIEIVDKDHPITRGLPPITQHPDELYHNLSNPQNAPVHVLMQAMDAVKNGTGKYEPMAITIEYGKGRVFATPLGHVWVNDHNSKRSILDPQFKVLLVRGTEWAATGKVSYGSTWNDVRRHNVLSAEEKAAGFTLLFDGTPSSAAANWRQFKGEKFPDKGWMAKDGALMHAAGGEGGDLMTKGEYGDFEFACQWKIAKGGNSGIIYRSTEDHGQPYETGPEMQVLDDEGHKDAKPKNRAGSMYDMFPTTADTSRPAGEWNNVRIVVRGTHHQYWLNGVKVVDVDSTSPDYAKALAASKWKDVPDFNKRTKGHIDLQNHGDEVWYRDLRVRELK